MTDKLPAQLSDIPASLIDVAESVGLQAVQDLIRTFGGLEVKFPVAPGPDHPVIKALGEANGTALCSYLGGQMLYVPHMRPARSARGEVLKMQAEGLDRAAIAQALGISQRHVRRVANQGDDDERQGDLFD